MKVEHRVLTTRWPAPTVAVTVLAQLCGPKVKEKETGAKLFTNNGQGRNLDLTDCIKTSFNQPTIDHKAQLHIHLQILTLLAFQVPYTKMRIPGRKQKVSIQIRFDADVNKITYLFTNSQL